jgi:hypothetical protein
LKSNESRKGWGCGSSGRASVWQVQEPEFNSSTVKKKKGNIIIVSTEQCYNFLFLMVNHIVREFKRRKIV